MTANFNVFFSSIFFFCHSKPLLVRDSYRSKATATHMASFAPQTEAPHSEIPLVFLFRTVFNIGHRDPTAPWVKHSKIISLMIYNMIVDCDE